MEKCLYEMDHGLKTFLGPSVEVVRELFSILIVQELPFVRYRVLYVHHL